MQLSHLRCALLREGRIPAGFLRGGAQIACIRPGMAVHICSSVSKLRLSVLRTVQAVMVDKPKEKAGGRASAMDTMGYSPSGMPAGLTL